MLRKQTVAPNPCSLLMNFFWKRYCSGHYYSKVNASFLAQLAPEHGVSVWHARRNVVIMLSTSSYAILALEQADTDPQPCPLQNNA